MCIEDPVLDLEGGIGALLPVAFGEFPCRQDFRIGKEGPEENDALLIYRWQNCTQISWKLVRSIA